MIKKILYIFIFISLFISFLFNAFAFEANLSLEKEKVDINDYINLKVEISSVEGGEIGITNIKGIDKFDIVSQSQSQSSSSSVVIIDGKTQTKTKTSLLLNLVLKAKNKGDFSIGPAILKRGNEEVKTNIVNVSVSGDKLFINNNHLQISQNNSKMRKEKKDILVKEEEIETYDNIEQRTFNNTSLYIFIGILLLFIAIFYLLLKKKKNFLDKKNIKKEEKENNSIQESKKEIDFEQKPSKIIYPDVTDSDFISKISSILKNKLASKYKIDLVDNKTFSELIEIIGLKEDDSIYILIEKINKAKYSNYITDNNEILSSVKEI